MVKSKKKKGGGEWKIFSQMLLIRALFGYKSKQTKKHTKNSFKKYFLLLFCITKVPKWGNSYHEIHGSVTSRPKSMSISCSFCFEGMGTASPGLTFTQGQRRRMSLSAFSELSQHSSGDICFPFSVQEFVVCLQLDAERFEKLFNFLKLNRLEIVRGQSVRNGSWVS